MKDINENNKFAYKTQGTQSTSELRRQLNEILRELIKPKVKAKAKQQTKSNNFEREV